MIRRASFWFIFFALAAGRVCGQDGNLPGTETLSVEGDLSTLSIEAIDNYFVGETENSVAGRDRYWKLDTSSASNYEKSVRENRRRFRESIGVVDRLGADSRLEILDEAAVAEKFAVHTVRWGVCDGVTGEGLLLKPRGEPVARIIVIPDADILPEQMIGLAENPRAEWRGDSSRSAMKMLPPQSQVARRLADLGCEVIVPMLIDRGIRFSGNELFLDGGQARPVRTNQTHRELIYRQAFMMGRHIIGYEVEKAISLVNWFEAENKRAGREIPIGIFGYGEGGLIALYSAAVRSTPVRALVVSGYFEKREDIWREPIYRNVWGLLREFGDAEIARLVAPGALIIEAARGPAVQEPPPAPAGVRACGTPGELRSPTLESVRAEFDRTKPVYESLGIRDRIQLAVSGPDGQGEFGSDEALKNFLRALGVEMKVAEAEAPPLVDVRTKGIAARLHGEETLESPYDARLRRQFSELVRYSQKLAAESPQRRAEFRPVPEAGSVSPEEWDRQSEKYREYFWEEVIGKLPPPSLPPRPRSRVIYETPKWKGYEVMLDVWPGVFAYGILCVPLDIGPAERRPTVVFQHGRAGRPQDSTDPNKDTIYYHSIGARLADMGFVVFAPQGPFLGEEKYRLIQRKANPLKKTFFSVMLGQHQQILNWLSSLKFVDPARIGFYGLSYGGKSAMFLPPLLKDYCLSIPSGDFNEEVGKHVSLTEPFTFMFTVEYEHLEFNAANTFNYAELAALIAPRPFMVERGTRDNVGRDDWVLGEFEKVRKIYGDLGIPERTEIEVFDGEHEIHAAGTVKFLRRHLAWERN